MAVPDVMLGSAQRAHLIAPAAEKIVTPLPAGAPDTPPRFECPVLNSASRNSRDTLVPLALPTRSNCSLGPLTQRGIMNFKLTSWLLSFALAVLLFGIVSIVLFDRMHAAL
jgi:hypothetical protein